MEAPFRKRACLVVNEKREGISFPLPSASCKSNQVSKSGRSNRWQNSSSGEQLEHWVKICVTELPSLKSRHFLSSISGRCVCSNQGQEGVRWLGGGVALIFRYFRYNLRFCQSLSFKGPQRVQPWRRDIFYVRDFIKISTAMRFFVGGVYPEPRKSRVAILVCSRGAIHATHPSS